jgi:hypothetical protein
VNNFHKIRVFFNNRSFLNIHCLSVYVKKAFENLLAAVVETVNLFKGIEIRYCQLAVIKDYFTKLYIFLELSSLDNTSHLE